MSKKVKNSHKPPRRRPLLEEIEPRILYSADFAPGLTEASTLAPQAEQRIVEPTGEFAQSAGQDAQARRHEIVFVDPATPDYARLVEGIRGQNSGRDIEVVRGAGGPPQLRFYGGAAVRFASLGATGSLLTLTHSRELAIAHVLLVR